MIPFSFSNEMKWNCISNSERRDDGSNKQNSHNNRKKKKKLEIQNGMYDEMSEKMWGEVRIL